MQNIQKYNIVELELALKIIRLCIKEMNRVDADIPDLVNYLELKIDCMKNYNLTVSIPTHLYDRIHKLSNDWNMPKNDIIKKALAKYLAILDNPITE